MENQKELEKIFQECVEYFFKLQDEITEKLEAIDQQETCFHLNKENFYSYFIEDLWDYRESSSMLTGGGGRSRIIQQGRIFEKGGVNVSDVWGIFSNDFSKTMPGESNRFRASGISIVLHPNNPYIPTVHANFRIIKRMNEKGKIEKIWFGGGADLTPYLLFEEDAFHFHNVWKEVCDQFKPKIDYNTLKKQCDEYFYIPHRKEHRGIGGIFFDYLSDDLLFYKDFIFFAGKKFLDSYIPILLRRKDIPYSNIEREYQCYRRSRYVEFNLIYDRGTTFGLKTGGRVESILMSLPFEVKWKYNYNPLNDPAIDNSIKKYIKNLYEVIYHPKDWLKNI